MALAGALARLKKDAEADALFVRVHALRLKALGPEHPDVASGLHARGQFFAERRRYADAEPLLVQAHALRLKLLGAAHPETVRTAQALEAVQRATGKAAEAKALATRLP